MDIGDAGSGKEYICIDCQSEIFSKDSRVPPKCPHCSSRDLIDK